MSTIRVASLLVAGLALAGCAKLGPAAIHNGRAAYNEALISTGNAQLLSLIVRARYGEASSLLAVASITASVRFSARAGADFGIGPDENFAGNLVPFGISGAYEENPTISYLPVQSEDYLRQMLSPLPLDIVALILNAIGETPGPMMLLVREINGVNNPAFLSDPEAPIDPRFGEIAELLASMHRRGAVTWLQTSEDGEQFTLILRATDDREIADVTHLRELLRLPELRSEEGHVMIPVTFGVGPGGKDAIELRTRSIQQLMMIASGSVDVPPEHIESGFAWPAPAHASDISFIQVKRSKSRPKHAMVAIPAYGQWYWIDARDQRSKETFRLIDALIAARIADSVDGSSKSPVLTIPVSD